MATSFSQLYDWQLQLVAMTMGPRSITLSNEYPKNSSLWIHDTSFGKKLEISIMCLDDAWNIKLALGKAEIGTIIHQRFSILSTVSSVSFKDSNHESCHCICLSFVLIQSNCLLRHTQSRSLAVYNWLSHESTNPSLFRWLDKWLSNLLFLRLREPFWQVHSDGCRVMGLWVTVSAYLCMQILSLESAVFNEHLSLFSHMLCNMNLSWFLCCVLMLTLLIFSSCPLPPSHSVDDWSWWTFMKFRIQYMHTVLTPFLLCQAMDIHHLLRSLYWF